MPEAVIVATARSPIGRAFKGSLTTIRPDDLVSQMITAALAKVPQLDPADIEDLLLGCGLPGGEQGFNLARVVAVALGYDHLPGATVTRYCSSSLQTTRMAFHALHDRGRVLTDLAVAIADGATTIGEIDTLRHQGELFGPAASDTTAWRTLAGCDGAALARISKARAKARRHVWDLIEARHGGIPPAKVAGRDLGKVTVIRLDATIVVAHSDKQQARGTFKGTWGHHPLTAWCDNTDESPQ